MRINNLNNKNDKLQGLTNLSFSMKELLRTNFQKLYPRKIILLIFVPIAIASLAFLVNPDNGTLILTNTLIFSIVIYVMIFSQIHSIFRKIFKWVIRGFLFGIGFILALWFSLFLALVLGLQLAEKILHIIL